MTAFQNHREHQGREHRDSKSYPDNSRDVLKKTGDDSNRIQVVGVMLSQG